MFKQILTFYRLQTAGITICTIAVGMCLVKQPTFLDVLFIILIGATLHATGFGMNNLLDWKQDGKHHLNPIGKSIPLSLGLKLTSICASFFVFFVLTDLTINHNLLTPTTPITFHGIINLLYILVVIILGIGYNLFCKKKDMAMVLSIYIAFLVIFGYSLHGETITYSKSIYDYFPPILLLVAFYAGLQVYFQVNIEGSFKDIESDKEYSFAAENGCTKLNPSKRFMILATLLKFIGIITIMSIVYLVGKNDFTDIAVFLIIGQLVALYSMFHSTNRRNFIKDCGIMEILTYTTLVLVISPVIGGLLTICLVIFPLLWFISFNKLLFNSPLNPKV